MSPNTRKVPSAWRRLPINPVVDLKGGWSLFNQPCQLCTATCESWLSPRILRQSSSSGLLLPRFQMYPQHWTGSTKYEESGISWNLFAIWKDCCLSETIDVQLTKCLAVFIAVLLASLMTLLMNFAHGPVSRSYQICDVQTSHPFLSSRWRSNWSRNNGGCVVFPALEWGFAGFLARTPFPAFAWGFDGLTVLPSLSHIPITV